MKLTQHGGQGEGKQGGNDPGLSLQGRGVFPRGCGGVRGASNQGIRALCVQEPEFCGAQSTMGKAVSGEG